MYEMMVNALKKEIRLDADFYEWHINCELEIKNLDKILLEDAAVVKAMGLDEDDWE